MHTVIAVMGEPVWLSLLEGALDESVRVLRLAVDLAGSATVQELAQAQPALIVVDSADARWQSWTATPKRSPATRRIPVVVIVEAHDRLKAALDAGADHVLRVDELEETLPRLLAAEGRKRDEAHMAALCAQCEEPLPPLAREGIHEFNAGNFYRQHDLFEALWVQEAGPVRNLYRAILQVGVGYYHIRQGNTRGALKMLLRSLQWLAPIPDVCQGVDVARLKADSARVRMALEAYDPDVGGEFDMTLLQPIKLVAHGDGKNGRT